MASIKPFKDGWRAQIAIKVDGKSVRDSATFLTKREANAWAAAREAEIRNPPPVLPPTETKTLGDALRRYGDEVSPQKRGARWEEIRIALFLRSAELPVNARLADLTSDDLGRWRDVRLTQVSAGSVLREISLLSAVLETARREWKWLPVNPMVDVRRPREPDHREVVITRQQIRAMLVAMDYRRGDCRSVTQAVARAFLFALRTGMRAGEICALTWNDVFPDHCTITAKEVGAGKTGKRDVPLIPQARRIIDSMAGYDPVYVFGLKTASLDALFRKYRARAGLDGFTFHDTRHTAATFLARRLDSLTLCKVFGWKNATMALTYYNPKASDIAKFLHQQRFRNAANR